MLRREGEGWGDDVSMCHVWSRHFDSDFSKRGGIGRDQVFFFFTMQIPEP